MPKRLCSGLLLLAALALSGSSALGVSQAFKDNIFDPGPLAPTASTLTVKVGQKAPGFTLRAISGETISLAQFIGQKNVVLSFVPAAWTPVCSDQWPGYNIAKPIFEAHDAILLGITVDNLATLYAWTNQMGRLWFPVLSDFWPHGQVAQAYGVLRSDGTSERALFIIDKQGVLQYARVTDINQRPDLKDLAQALEKLKP